MVRKFLTCFLILSLVNLPLFAQTKAEKKAAQEAARIAGLKTTINGYGTGEAALIEVKRKSGKKVKGYISEVKDDSFIVADTAAASSYEVRYSEVEGVKPWKPSTGPSSKGMVVMWVAIGIGVTVLAIFAYKRCKRLEREGKTCTIDEETY
jgi:hypothetical protein